jgi:hypothetical protein
MTALLRADWLRFRRRRDLWFIGIAVLLIGGLSFIAGYHADVTDPLWPDAAAIRAEVLGFSDFGGMTQAEIEAQVDLMVADQTAMYDQQRLDFEAHQAVALQKYALPQSLLTVVGSGTVPLIALVFVASLVVGDEFRFGTLRTSLLAAGNRRRFLFTRLVSLFAMTVGVFAILLALGVVLSLALILFGAEVPAATTPLNVGASVGLIGAEILSVTVLVALATALTLLLRSGALPLLLVILGFLLESFIAALPFFALGQTFAGVPQFFLSTSIRTLLGRLGSDAGAVALAENGQLPNATIDLGLPVVAAIIAAWGLLFLFLADRRIRTMDVVE